MTVQRFVRLLPTKHRNNHRRRIWTKYLRFSLYAPREVPFIRVAHDSMRQTKRKAVQDTNLPGNGARTWKWLRRLTVLRQRRRGQDRSCLSAPCQSSTGRIPPEVGRQVVRIRFVVTVFWLRISSRPEIAGVPLDWEWTVGRCPPSPEQRHSLPTRLRWVELQEHRCPGISSPAPPTPGNYSKIRASEGGKKGWNKHLLCEA